MRALCGPQTVTPMLLENVNDNAYDGDEELPSHATLIDSDSDESADETRSDASSDDEVDRPEEVPLSTILSEGCEERHCLPSSKHSAGVWPGVIS